MPSAPAGRPRHAREWLLALALALAAHAALLGRLPELDPGPAVRDPAGPAAVAVLVVRTLEPASGDADALPAPRRAEAAPGRSASSGGPPGTPSGGAAAATPMLPLPAAPGTSLPPLAAAAPPGGAGDASEPGEEGQPLSRAEAYAGAPPPVWATRLPPDFVAHYALRRGQESARAATLRLDTAQGRYELLLQAEGAGRGPQQASQGRLEATGLAPERYLDRRRARAAAAANFDRGRDRITYSGAPLEQPLFAGTQDRLSWIVQLAAIVEADPARWQPRASLPLYVSGARGDAQLWVFQVRGRTAPEGADASAGALLHLVREPERPYDLRVEAWLDPQRHHLPARLVMSPVPGGQALEWTRIP